MTTEVSVRALLKRLERRAIFAPSAEILNIGLPILFLVATFAFGINRSWQASERFWLEMAALAIFGNAYHVMFSIWNLFYMEEFKTINKKLGLGLWKWGAGFIAILAFFSISHDFGFYKSIYPLRAIAIWMICLLPVMHRTRQSMGISLLYNSRQFTEIEKAEVERFVETERSSRKWEHYATNLILAGVFMITLSARSQSFLPAPKELLFKFGIFTVVVGLTTLVIALWKLRNYRALTVIKSLFNLRQLLIPLAAFTYLGMIGVQAMHGFEYTLLQGHMMKRSASTKRATVQILLPLALLVLLDFSLQSALVLRHFNFDVSRRLTSSMILIAAALSYVHYAMDSVYFRLGHPIVRESILPLLRRAPIAEEGSGTPAQVSNVA